MTKDATVVRRRLVVRYTNAQGNGAAVLEQYEETVITDPDIEP